MTSEVLDSINNATIARSWKASNADYGTDHFHEEEEGDTVFFALEPSFSVSDWVDPENDSSFGETTMKPDKFPCMRSFSNDVAATVNQAFLKNLQRLLSTSFPHSVQTVVDRKRSQRIVFTGHSSGGATAILATVWYLEEYFTKQSDDFFPKPLCLTFGAPLVGNYVFKHALGRENWSRFFFNFVTRFDIVPRIMLAPKESTKQALPHALSKLDPRVAPIQENDQIIAGFYATVMKEVETAVRQAGCELTKDGENAFLDTFSSFLELSPYRPAGNFVFSTETRLVLVSNSDAVLQLLFYSSQASNEQDLSQRPYQSITDHRSYQGMVDSVNQLPFVEGESELSDLVLTESARDRVHAAFEAEKKRDDNQKKIYTINKTTGKTKIVERVEAIENYKGMCVAPHAKGYYDSFRESDNTSDFDANVKRAELAGLFDDAFGLLKKGQLPDGFEGRSEWIELATRYRKLVEPLDIANYYRHLKNQDTGPYMTEGIRPKRYKHAQRLYEHGLLKKGKSAEEIKRSGFGSCFWAEVEELRGEAYDKERVTKLEKSLQGWISDEEVDDKHIFLEGSTFRKWWDLLPEVHKVDSLVRVYMV